MKDPFWKRKLKQLGKALGYNLMDANRPSEIFEAILKYRNNTEHGAPSEDEYQFLLFILRNFGDSKAQLFQDLLALYLKKSKKQGFFVEFCATDGVTLSNTYLLETKYQWSGILVEPARNWHEKLASNRKCAVDHQCVWSVTGTTLNFREADIGELSTIESFADSDGHSEARKRGNVYPVQTITLNDLLRSLKAPRHIDYLSIDTEGSEFEILNSFDFSEYQIDIITVEHNFTEKREKIHLLLMERGYVRIFSNFSHFDDWYVKNDYP